MWKCHKCGKPVFFAERKQSLGYDWHPECLRCEECGKRLNPGQHAEHKGVPYCHVPCYGALFGPQLFGHGTRVESHKSFGQKGSPKLGNGAHGSQRVLLEAKLKEFNQYFEGKSGEVRSREVNGRLILEGSLRIFWGVHGVIHLKENDDQRTVVTVRKRNSCRVESDSDSDDEFGATDMSTSTVSDNVSLSLEDESADRTDTGIESGGETTSECGGDLSSSTLSPINGSSGMPKSQTLPSKLVDVKNMEWDELDDLLQVERKVDDSDKLYQTMPTPFPAQNSTESTSSESSSTDRNCLNSTNTSYTNAESNISSDVTLKACNHSDISDGSTVRNDDDSTGESSASYRQYQQAVSGQSDDTWLTAQTSHHLNRSMSGPDCLDRSSDRRGLLSPPALQTNSNIMTDSATSCDISTSNEFEEDVVVLRRKKAGSTAIKRRTGKRLSRSKVKRRCSINGHFYDRETSFFTPPHGSQMSVWVSSLVNTQEVINLMLEKYKVDSDARHFALFIVRDNGEQKRLKDDDYPLMVRVLLGPHEDVSRLFLMDSHNTPEVSNEVAQFLNLSVAECRAILNQYCTQEEREILRIQEKYREIRWRMKQKLEESK